MGTDNIPLPLSEPDDISELLVNWWLACWTEGKASTNRDDADIVEIFMTCHKV